MGLRHLLLSIFIGLSATFLVAVAPALSQPPPSGDWVVTGSETAENGTITLDGNLIVSATGSLTLTNVTLAMDCSNDGEFGITVEPGGALSVAGSVITSATGKGFDFAVHGASFEMIDSELHGAGWGPEQGLGNSPSAASGERGLVIGTDNALLAGNTISRNHVGGILTDNAILSNTVHGIHVQGGEDNRIVSNTIRHGGRASSPIRMHSASGNHIVSNTIRSSIHRGIIETFESEGCSTTVTTTSSPATPSRPPCGKAPSWMRRRLPDDHAGRVQVCDERERPHGLRTRVVVRRRPFLWGRFPAGE